MAAIDNFPCFKTIVCGQTEDLPSQLSNVVRIFISSTFTDTVEERNRLIKEVFPDLRRYCQTKGLDFEVVDMRWGVRDNATSDHLTSLLCLQEIDNCKRLSMGPSFVALLGNKYGYRPLPSTMTSDEFEKLRDLARTEVDFQELQLLDDWFRQDANSVPPIHVLQPITANLKDYYNEEDQEKRKHARSEWWKVFDRLQCTLRTAAKCAVRDGLYTAEQMHKYFFSVTEDEVRHGLKDSQAENCLFFMRDIEGIGDHVDTPNVAKYIDVNDEGKVDADAQSHLRNLKNMVDDSNITNLHKYTIPWSPNGIDATIPEHNEYLDKFCKTFTSSIKAMIDKRLETRSKTDNQVTVQLYEEMLHHALFCFNKCSKFHGRQDILMKARDFLTGNHERPLVVHGVSGSGKTSVMAMIAKLGREWLGDSTVVIFRFLGTSAHSSSIQETLGSVCRQICYAYEVNQPASDTLDDFTKLVQYFRQLLSTLPTNDKPLFLLLDSIDQLQPQNDAHSMNWLPKRLDKNLHIAISMLPELYGCLDKLKETLTTEECYHVMPPVPSNTGVEILEAWLQQEGRSLTEQQKEAVAIAFQKCPRPLFLKLLFENVVRWRSYQDPSSFDLPTDVRHAITILFEKIEHKHGMILASHALGYLTAAKSGRTQTELEDVLSCDDEVLNDVYQYWDPPVETIVRIPSSLWKRIHHDIGDFLVERQADGKTVIAWYHRQFWEAAQDRFLGSSDVLKKRHELLARMFLGEFSEGNIRPITLHARGKTFENADRQTAIQPLVFNNEVFNLRKLQELPNHLNISLMHETLADKVLFSFPWILTKLRAFSFLDLMSDFQIDGKEINMLREMMYLSSSNLKADPFTLAGQLIGRLDRSEMHPQLTGLVDQARCWVEEESMPKMAPRSTCLMQPGGPLQVTLAGHPTRVLKVACTSSGKYLVSACEDSKGHIMANVWDMEITELIHTLQLDNSIAGLKGHLTMALTNNDRYVLLANRAMGMFDLHNGECVTKFETDDSLVYTDLKMFEELAIAGSKEGNRVCAWTITDGKCLWQVDFPDTVPCIFTRSPSQLVAVCSNGVVRTVNIHNGETLLEGSTGSETVVSAMLTPDESEVITGHKDNVIRTWKLHQVSVELRHSLSGHKKPAVKLLVNNSEHQLISASLDSSVRVWDLQKGSALFTLEGHDGAITCMSFIFLDGRNMVVSGSKDDNLKIWDTTTGKVFNTLEGHSSWISDVTVAVTNSSVRVISACNDKTVKAWIPTKVMISSLSRHDGSPRCIAMTFSGRFVATSAWAEGKTKVWSGRGGKCLHVIPTESFSMLTPKHDDECVVGGNPAGNVYCWDFVTGTQRWSCAAHTKGVSHLCWGYKGDLITAGGFNAKLWGIDLASGGMQLKATYNKHEADITAVAVTKARDPGIVVTACKKGVVKLWEYQSGECLRTVSHDDKVECVSISASDRLLVSGSKNGTMSVWSLDKDDLGGQINTSTMSKDSVICGLFTKDEKHVICGLHQGKQQLFQWDYRSTDTKTSKIYLKGHHHAVMMAHLTSDGNYLLTSSRDCTMKAWHLPTSRLVASFDCQSQIKYFGVAEIARDRYFVAAATKMAVAFLDVFLSEDADRTSFDSLQAKHDKPPEDSINTISVKGHPIDNSSEQSDGSAAPTHEGKAEAKKPKSSICFII